MKDIKIEKGIPIPDFLRRGVDRLKVFESMEFGDSFLVEEKSERNSIFQQHIHKKKIGFPIDYIVITRKVEGGYRIWKVKKD
jgi:hypothetical protein